MMRACLPARTAARGRKDWLFLSSSMQESERFLIHGKQLDDIETAFLLVCLYLSAAELACCACDNGQ